MDTLALLIEQKMKGLGLANFRLETRMKNLSLDDTNLSFQAQNEYWFLYDVSASNDDFLIQGDNDIVRFSDINFAGIPLVRTFTGNICIEKLGEPTEEQKLLFIVAIPKQEEK
jgi:hypothetical protein